MVQKEQLGHVPSWDLSAWFNGKDDPRIGATFEEGKKRAGIFAKFWRGQLTDATSATDIRDALQNYESILQKAVKPLLYAESLHTTDATNEEYGALQQKVEAAYTEICNEFVFFDLELLQLAEETLQRFINAPELENYRHYLSCLLKTKPHRLSEREEQLMNDKALTGSSAFLRLFGEELSRKKFPLTIDGERRELTEEEVLDMLSAANREERIVGAEAFTRGLREDVWRLAFIFNTLGENKRINDKYFRFSTPEESRHLANETTQEAVDTMSAAVTDHAGVVADYYRLKRNVLDLEELYDYDRYAPIAETQRIYSFETAQQVVLAAYGSFSPVMREQASEFFEKNWIDAETRHGKRGGAYCSYMTPDTHPLVFLNYLGKSKSVLTLAHELGHGVHASLMRKQTLLNFDTPLTIAETASVFGEMLIFDSLRNSMNGKELLALLMGMIEEVFATVFRQHAMYKFEQDFHAARRSEGELSPEHISNLWIARQKEMFGDSVTLTDNYRIWWSYIPHFLHTPFYVYAYTFGELLTLSFYDMYKKTADKAAFAEQYIRMLEASGSKTPEELVEPFGIDLSQKEFWEGGLRVIEEMVEEAKELRKTLQL